MINRRDFVAAAAFLPFSAPAWSLAATDPGTPALPPGNDIRFRVIRNGSQIGSHELSFSAVANGFDVRIAVDIAVYFGPIRLFHYKLAGVEQWRDGKVAQVTTDTDDDGTAAYIRANRDEQGLWVTGSSAKRRYLAPPGALPATHWNQAELDGPWINPQDGKLFHPVVNSRGVEQVTIGGGTARSATHYDLSGDVTLQLWYDAERQWTALSFIKGGSAVRYELA